MISTIVRFPHVFYDERMQFHGVTFTQSRPCNIQRWRISHDGDMFTAFTADNYSLSRSLLNLERWKLYSHCMIYYHKNFELR
jgi:hypothetical protein